MRIHEILLWLAGLTSVAGVTGMVSAFSMAMGKGHYANSPDKTFQQRFVTGASILIFGAALLSLFLVL